MSRRVLAGAIWVSLCLIAIIAATILDPFLPKAHAGGWTGCYGGVAGGYTTATTDASVAFGGGAVDIDSLGYSGGSYTGLAGCDLQANAKILLGVWGDWTKDNADFDVTITGVPALLHTGLDNHWGVGGRAGYLVTDKSMIYLLAGYTQADVQDISSPAFGPTAVLSVPTLKGYVLGAGAEFALGNNFFLQAQYSFANYDKANIALGTSPGDPVLGLDTDVQTARVGLTYKIGASDAPVIRDVAKAIGPTPLK